MKELCKICNQEILEDSHFWKTHRVKMQDYYEKNFPIKKDLFSGEVIPFKGRERFYLDLFINKTNLQSYLNTLPKQKQAEFIISLLKTRIEIKDLKWTPTQVELKSLLLPSMITYIRLCGDYYTVCEELGLKNKFTEFLNYPEPPKENAFIYVDTREQKPLSFSFYQTQITKLEFGDYAFCSNDVIGDIYVERKSLTDFISTLSQGYERFQNEIERASAMGKYLIIMVESPLIEALNFKYLKWKTKFTKASPDFIFHRVRELLQKYPHIQFVFCKNREHMESLINGVISKPKISFDIQYAIDQKII